MANKLCGIASMANHGFDNFRFPINRSVSCCPALFRAAVSQKASRHNAEAIA